MIELVGTCEKCKRPVYCRDGFIDGIVQSDKTVICFACSDDEVEKKDEKS
ncbi:hypothetical protein ABE504_17195 [Paenibacillus oryzisoli]